MALLAPPEGYRPGEFVPDDVVRAIVEARTVKMWRLVERADPTSQAGLSGKPMSERTEDDWARDAAVQLRSVHETVGDGVKLDETKAIAFKKLLLAQASYTGPMFSGDGERLKKRCGFFPIIRALFSTDDTEIEVWICFFCSDLAVLGKDRRLGGDDFKPISRELLALVQSVLKDDPVIIKIRAR